MGWVPENKRGVSEEPQPAPRRRRRQDPRPDEELPPSTRRHRRLRDGPGPVVEQLAERDERVTTSRPAAGKRGERAPGPVIVKLGHRWSQIVREIRAGDYTWQQFAEGLTGEELARGQLRADDGTFTGRPPSIVPREFHLACFRELKRRFDEQFQSSVLAIAQEYVVLAQDKEIPAKDRAKMMQYAMERVFGGIPKEVLVKQDAPWEQVVTTVVAEDGEPGADWRKNRYATYEEGSDDDGE